MPESVQIQSKSQVKTVEVPKRIYNVIKSIVDSSTKPDYDWNKPIVVSENVVKFVKYKTLQNGVEVKAWEIVVQPMVVQREGAELAANLITVYDGLGNMVAELIVRNEFTITEQDIEGFSRYIIRVGKEKIAAKSLHEFEYYVIMSREEIPYARPISLAAFINKLMFYFNKAIGVMRNDNTSEDVSV
jgi:hypothetical protein